MNISYFSSFYFSKSSFPQFSFCNTAVANFVQKSAVRLCALIFLFALANPISAYAQSDNTFSPSSIAMVNINSADADELSSKLFGVGESKAQAIVEYREKMGVFKSVDDLILVRGIGEKTLSENRHLLVLSN